MTQPQTAPTPAPETPRRLPTVTVAERAQAALLRRLENPEDSYAPVVMRLKDDPTGSLWHLRWGNDAIEGRHYQLVNRKGYVPVMRSELADLEDIPDLADSPDGVVRRGEKGKEVLYKIPKDAFEQIKRAEVNAREAASRSTRSLRQQAAESAAAKFGSEAGDFIAGRDIGGIRSIGDISARVERVSSDEE